MGTAPSSVLNHRLTQIRRALADASLDALVVTSLPNVLYLTNFTGSSAIAVITGSGVLFVTDSRYVTVVSEAQRGEHGCPGLELIKVDVSYDASLVDVLGRKLPSNRLFG